MAGLYAAKRLTAEWCRKRGAVLRVAFGGVVAMLVTCWVGQIGETTL